MAQPSPTGQSVCPAVQAMTSHRLSLGWGPSPGATAVVYRGPPGSGLVLHHEPFLPFLPQERQPQLFSVHRGTFPILLPLGHRFELRGGGRCAYLNGTGSAHPCATYTSTGSAAELTTTSSGSKRCTHNETSHHHQPCASAAVVLQCIILQPDVVSSQLLCFCSDRCCRVVFGPISLSFSLFPFSGVQICGSLCPATHGTGPNQPINH